MSEALIALPKGMSYDEYFLLSAGDDTEDAPWMVMSPEQFHAASRLYTVLYAYSLSLGQPWHAAGMTEIRYPKPDGTDGKLAPDLFISSVPVAGEEFYKLGEDRPFPLLVLEVVSPSSVYRDLYEKVELYRILGAQEYVIYMPVGEVPTPPWLRRRTRRKGKLLDPPLQGYRRDESGDFVAWEPDESGRLFSEVLGLWLVADELDIRAQLPDGTWLLTPEEIAAQLRQSELRRQEAEAEAAQLHEELKCLRRDEQN